MGRTRSGIDCVGLPMVVGAEMGLHEYDDSISYRRIATNHDLIRAIGPHSVRIRDLSDLRDADVVVMRHHVFPQHVMMIAHKGPMMTVIHSSVERGKVVEEPLTNDVRRLLITGFRYKDLA
jgi:hypothetical protein